MAYSCDFSKMAGLQRAGNMANGLIAEMASLRMLPIDG